MVPITAQADETPTGKCMEATIESVDGPSAEVWGDPCGMREAASRDFWGTPGALRLLQRLGPGRGQESPKLEPDEVTAP